MNNKIVAYCDGGCRGNQNKENIGGWGVYLTFKDKTKELGGATTNTTNNKMELEALLQTLKVIKNKNITTEIFIDSAYVVNGVNQWINNWIKKGWVKSDKKPVENKEIWKEILKEKNKFTDLTILKCKGHSDVFGNNKADELANKYMSELEV